MSVTIDAHPTDEAIIIRSTNSSNESVQQIINLKDLNENVDIHQLADTILSKSAYIPLTHREDLVQILFYLQKRLKTGIRAGSASSSDSVVLTASSIKASMENVDDYIELFYEDIQDKVKGALCVLELAKENANFPYLAANDTLMGALARVFREDGRKSFELATTIAQVFLRLSYFHQFHSILTNLKVGALCLNSIEFELKRGEAWVESAKTADSRTARKCQVAIRKQHSLLTVCLSILYNMAVDLSIELKMVRRDLVPLLIQCLFYASSSDLQLAVVTFLLKLSVFEENKALMEVPNAIDKFLSLFPIEDSELRKQTVRLLFNLSFEAKAKKQMVSGGLVSHIAPLIQNDSKALNLLYQLSINDDAKAMITFTDAIKLLMTDLLTGSGSAVTKSILINACLEKRSAQIVCGANGQGLDLLMEVALDNGDLLVAKIITSISVHEGASQDLFVKWMPKLLTVGMTESVNSAEERAAIGLECISIAAQIKSANWISLCKNHDLVPWMGEQLKSTIKEQEPLQLQIVIMCGTMARQLEAAKALVPLLEIFLTLLHTMQVDDEFVAQLLYLFLQLLRHKELSDRLMGPQSSLGVYIIDLMHDKNAAIREMCANALVIIGEHSQEWHKRIATARFRWHNEQWLSMLEGEQVVDDYSPAEDDYGVDVIYDDQFDDGLESEEALF